MHHQVYLPSVCANFRLVYSILCPRSFLLITFELFFPLRESRGAYNRGNPAEARTTEKSVGLVSPEG